jgi:hypothetical protein
MVDSAAVHDQSPALATIRIECIVLAKNVFQRVLMHPTPPAELDRVVCIARRTGRRCSGRP